MPQADFSIWLHNPITGKSIIYILYKDCTLTDYTAGKDIDFFWDTDTGILLEN